MKSEHAPLIRVYNIYHDPNTMWCVGHPEYGIVKRNVRAAVVTTLPDAAMKRTTFYETNMGFIIRRIFSRRGLLGIPSILGRFSGAKS